jgi:hypothetical protein
VCSASITVTKVEYVLNPAQLRAYRAFVAAEQARGTVIEERFVFQSAFSLSHTHRATAATL